MIAVDTNVVVRLIVGDDEKQAKAALALAARERLYISLTVLTETEWVLRSAYGLNRRSIVTSLSTLGDLVPITFKHSDGVRWALDRYAVAGELADYLHIAAAHAVGRFASFERKLARRAGPNSPATIETLA